MKAIQVKYLPATNTRGKRYKVMAEGVKSRVYGAGFDSDDRIGEIVNQFCLENNWPNDLVSGQLPNGDYVFCFRCQ